MHDVNPTAPLRPAATLLLVREHAGEVQACLLRRSPSARFMPGVFVFPGGLVDSGDGEKDFWGKHADLGPHGGIHRRGRGFEFPDAVSYGIAAIRETFEEAGILLARPSAPSAAALERARERRLNESPRQGWFRRLVESEGWTLGLSALSPWSHWITPVGMPLRFDTRFFMAPVPDGQDCRPDQREITEGLWIDPGQALARNLDGRTPLSPPTLVTLQGLLRYPTLERLQTEARRRGWGPPIFPRLISVEGNPGVVIIEPWDPMYGAETILIDAASLPASVLPAGEPFSRLWNDGGSWKPIALS